MPTPTLRPIATTAGQLKKELDQLGKRINEANELIEQTVRQHDTCRRLVSILGIGPVTATAAIAAIGNGAAFHKGREFAAWLGLTSREHSAVNKNYSASVSAGTLT